MSKNEVNYDINIASKAIKVAKAGFAAYIKDSTIPLSERWSFFVASPNYVKEQDTYIHTFKWESTHGGLEWYDNFYCDRYANVTMEQIIDTMYDRVDEANNNWNFINIAELQEEILSKNLGSFVNDW